MMPLFEHFERVYIVNLPERADRRNALEKEFSRLGYAVDGSHIRYFSAIRPDDAGEFPSIGAKGCFLSHLNILKNALKDGLHNILILEDDVSFTPDWEQMSGHMLDPLATAPWHFIYFGHNETLEQNTAGLVPTTSPIATTHCYALNGDVIKPLHDYLELCLSRPAGHPMGGAMHVDGAYSLFRKLHPQYLTLIATPALAYQRSSRSDIYPNKWYDRNVLLQHVAEFLRHIKNKMRKHNTSLQQGKNA